MAECAFHPGVETGVRCVSCERPICPKDFVPTPVGYKCPECARQLPSARRAVKLRQLALASLAAGGVGIGGALALGMLVGTWWLASALLGLLAGEAARRASGGHRTAEIAGVAGVAVLAGTFLGGFDVVGMALGTAAAVATVLSNRW